MIVIIGLLSLEIGLIFTLANYRQENITRFGSSGFKGLQAEDSEFCFLTPYTHQFNVLLGKIFNN
ncbi:hypothetical protein ETSB_1296 [cyanobacterium endosymbiont of Epithemia turgida isolate EtSB Lake Yunoko]|nr:hypothetical protein ETSB_1296 [cyanobacterium endosymbiont of Epithemia turgida isolate EtSB Lake Yunoko]